MLVCDICGKTNSNAKGEERTVVKRIIETLSDVGTYKSNSIDDLVLRCDICDKCMPDFSVALTKFVNDSEWVKS